MESKTPTYDALVKKLRAYRLKEKLLSFYKGILWFFISTIPVLFIFVLLESFFHFYTLVRTCILIFLFFFVLIAFSFFIMRPLFSLLLRPQNPSLNQIAIKVGAHFKGINDRLANALQIFEKLKSNREKYSIELIDAAISDVARDLSRENFTNKINYSDFFKTIRISLAVLFAAVVISLFSFANLKSSTWRLLNPRHDFSEKQFREIQVWPGNKTVLKGADVPIRVWISDAEINRVQLNLNQFSNSDVINLTKSPDDTFRYTIPELRDSLRYSISIKNQETDEYKLSVIELPLLRRLQLKVNPPAYSRLQPYFLEENIGDVSALKGSLIEVSGEANKSIALGTISFGKGRKIPLEITDNRVKGRFNLLSDDTFVFHLEDKYKNQSINPIEYHLEVIPDQYPVVNIAVPGKDIDLGEDMRIPLAIQAQDDFGISRMRLAWQILPQGLGEVDSSAYVFRDLQGFKNGSDLLDISLDWDLSKSEMLPTDVLVYFAEVYDNDNISGPKKARSKIYRARFPSMSELYDELAENHDEAVEKMENVYEKSKELKNKIDQISLEMKRAKDINWQQKQEIEDALKTKQEIQKQLDKLSEKLDDMIEKMSKNELASAETIKKYQELQQLFKDIMTPELQQAMKNVAEAMQNLDQKLVQKAMEELKLSDEEFQKSLERSISLLKRLKIEQKLDQAAKMAEDLTKREKELGEKAGKDSDGKSLRKQDEIQKDANNLSQLLDDLKSEMADMPAMPEKNVDAAKSEMQSGDVQQKMNQMKQMMASGDSKGAKKQSQQLSQTFQKVGQQLQQAKDALSGAQQRRAMRALKKNGHNLLELSKMQEELMKATRGLPRNSAQAPKIAEKQNNLSSALSRTLDNMFEISKENFYISPKIGQSLGKAAANMKKALSSLENRNNKGAASQQGKAMAGLNEAVQGIQSSMQSMMQGSGSGMSMEQFMKQMSQMGKKQQGINQQTLGLGMGQKMSLAQQAAMARLAAEQQQVRKSMQELAREAGNSSEILGNMDKIVEDMKKVEKDFSQQHVSRETIERQNRILSRMLDAQKSMREREYSKKRKAETAKNYIAINPGELPKNLGEQRNRLQQDLLRAKKEGYTKDYLELIKRYFEALSEDEIDNNE